MMTSLRGTGSILRFILRRDRIRFALWVVGITALVLSSASSVQGIYKTKEQLAEAAAVIDRNPAVIAMNGPPHALDTLGGRVAFEVGAFGFAIVGLMSMFFVGRHTRAEEESERSELIRAAVVGRHAPTTAALLFTVATHLLLAAIVAFGLISLGLPTAGSLAFGAAMASVGLVFAGVSAVVVQITEHTRAAYGITGAVLGLAYVVRAAGDVGDGTLSWLSPLGWAQAVRAFANERWWVLLISLVTTAVLIYVAFALSSRRDFGAGLVRPRPGSPTASSSLVRPLGLALRLQRASLIGWTVGVFATGLSYGSVGRDIEDFVGDNKDIAEVLAQAGGNLTDSFFATTLLVLALIGTGFAIQSTLRLRAEESAGRAEPLLATAITRVRWAGSHLTVAAVGTIVLLAAAGLGAGLAYGVMIDDLSQVPRLMGAALVHVPGVWALIGFTVVLFGFVPRATAVAWAALGVCVVVGFLGELLGLPDWVVGVSPFDHVPQAPAVAVTFGPLLILSAVAAALAITGLTAFRRRDAGY